MLTKSIDFIFKLIKWPVALFLLISIPALLQSYNYFELNSVKVISFAGGAVLYLATMILAGQNISRTMQIISHELTHLLFAYLHFDKDKDAVVESPDYEVPACTVPDAGAEPYEEESAVFSALAENRDIQHIVAEEGTE